MRPARSGHEAARRTQPPRPPARAATPTAAVSDVKRIADQAPRSNTPSPSWLNVNTNGTRKAGSVYFQVSIIVSNGLAPVSAAAANGDSAVGGLTSDSTA